MISQLISFLANGFIIFGRWDLIKFLHEWIYQEVFLPFTVSHLKYMYALHVILDFLITSEPHKVRALFLRLLQVGISPQEFPCLVKSLAFQRKFPQQMCIYLS